MHAHQQNAFNAWWAKEHGTIDSQTGLVDALARAYGRAIWGAAIDAATHLPEAGKMVGEGIDWSAVYENKRKLLDKPSTIKDSDLRAIEKSIGVERTRTSDEEYIQFYPSEYSAFVNALESLILATPQAVHPKDDPAALWATIWRLRAELEAAQAVPAESVGYVRSINPMECTATIKWHPAQNGHFPDSFDIGSSLYLAPPAPTPPAEAVAPSGAATQKDEAVYQAIANDYKASVQSVPSADSIYEAIKHGDDVHRAWLKAALTAHFAGQPVPAATPPQAPPAPPALTDAPCLMSDEDIDRHWGWVPESVESRRAFVRAIESRIRASYHRSAP